MIRTNLMKYRNLSNFLCSLTVLVGFSILPAMAESLSGGPQVGSTQSGGPLMKTSSSKAQISSDSRASENSKSNAGKMSAGSTKTESVFKHGSSQTGTKANTNTGGYSIKTFSKDKESSKKSGAKLKHKSETVQYFWTGDKLKGKKVVEDR